MKHVFFAGLEHGLTEAEVTHYRSKFGRLFESLGLGVNDPTLGKDLAQIPRDQLLQQDKDLVEARSAILRA